jgi:hypothetical protein
MFSKFGILTCDILGLVDNTIVSQELALCTSGSFQSGFHLSWETSIIIQS